MNINVESQEAILNREIIIVPELQKNSTRIKYTNIKRLLDIIISIVGLIILSPLFLVLAIVIKLDSKGSVFFKHTRYGKNGKKFKMYKFRTMYENAQDMIKEFTPEQIKEWKENFKLKDDPRITKVGKFIRKTSLDELPQLWNVLKGDMSLVGPRPPLPNEVEQYTEEQKKRLSVTPGLTCYWQVQPSRNDFDFDEWFELDMQYLRERSIGTDIKIIFQTIRVVGKILFVF